MIESRSNHVFPAEAVAVIGIGCRFPGANDPESFWRLLREGVDAIGDVPRDRFDIDEFHDDQPASPGKVISRSGGFLDQVDQFDAQFFGISPQEATFLDPQQRLLLEVGWEALEDAGLPPRKVSGTQTGVFVGMIYNDYEDILFRSTERLNLYTTTGASRFTAAGRLSHTLNLYGPSMMVDTACSSSLVAVHLACQSLRCGECTLALAGGTHLILQPHVNICLSQGKVLASDGRCKFGDARADGYGRSEGVGVVVLKPLPTALADRDPIYAVILGTGVSHKGAHDGPMPTPSRHRIEAMMRETYAKVGLSPAQVQYVEAHGTGTWRGDLAEIPALGTVLAEGRTKGQSCRIGSVKTNIGHTEAASGVAGLIKLALSLKHGKIPPSLHFHNPNPEIPWADLPVIVQKELTTWPATDGPARAGLNSFGMSGTNVHAIVEEPPTPESIRSGSDGSPHLLCLSAKSENALRQLADRYVRYSLENPDASLEDVCYTANTGRARFSHRLAVVADSFTELRDAFSSFSAGPRLANAMYDTCPMDQPAERYVPPPGGGDPRESLTQMGRAYVRGMEVDFSDFYAGCSHRRVSVPTYPFQRKRYWFEPAEVTHVDRAEPFNVGDLLYEISWEPRGGVGEAPTSESPAPANGMESPFGHWLIFADQAGVGAALAGQLRMKGQTTTVVYEGRRTARSQSGQWEIRPDHPEDFARLERDLVDEALRGVVHLWSLDSVSAGELTTSMVESAQMRGCHSVLDLVRAMARRRNAPGFRLWLATRGAQPVRSPLDVCSPAQATLWGLGQVVTLEHPEIFGGLVDLDPSADPDQSGVHLLHELQGSDREDRVAYRAGVRHVARLVRRPNLVDSFEPLRLPKDATVLITGGLGNLGLTLARWFVECGSRHIALMSRRAPSQTAQRIIRELEQAGADVRVFQGDVARGDDVESVLTEIREDMPPLNGIVHAAGVAGSQPLVDMDREALAAVLQPKVLGGWNVHRHTGEIDLSFFVAISSAASVWGARGMGHYAAANHFLDALCHYRRSIGLPALSINWARLSDRGMVSPQLDSSLSQIGLKGAPIEQALDVLGRLMQGPVSQATFAWVDWDTFRPVYESKSRRPFLERIETTRLQTEDQTPAEESARLASLRSASPKHRREMLISLIRDEIGQSLGLDDAGAIDLSQGFFDMGMESLAALALRNRLQEILGQPLSSALLFEYSSVQALADHLVAEVLVDNQIAVPSSPPGRTPEPRKLLMPAQRRPETTVEAALEEELEAVHKLLERT